VCKRAVVELLRAVWLEPSSAKSKHDFVMLRGSAPRTPTARAENPPGEGSWACGTNLVGRRRALSARYPERTVMATAVKLAAVAVQRPGCLRTPKEASEYLGVPEKTLATWRSERRGPSFVKLEGRLVRYRASDLERYIESQIVETEIER
jgi:excisionase family DNA binding protein